MTKQEHTANADLETWQVNAINRVNQNYADKNGLALWETVRNPANKVSRLAVQKLNPEAPGVSAPIKEWLAFLISAFPTLEGQLKEKEENNAKQSEERTKEWEKRQLESIATGGAAYMWNNCRYVHALSFIEAMLSEGYIPQKTGIGTVKLVKGHIFIGPMRNKHINAAIKLKGF